MAVSEIIRVVTLSVSLFITLVGFLVTLVKAIKNVIKTKNWDFKKRFTRIYSESRGL